MLASRRERLGELGSRSRVVRVEANRFSEMPYRLIRLTFFIRAMPRFTCARALFGSMRSDCSYSSAARRSCPLLQRQTKTVVGWSIIRVHAECFAIVSDCRALPAFSGQDHTVVELRVPVVRHGFQVDSVVLCGFLNVALLVKVSARL